MKAPIVPSAKTIHVGVINFPEQLVGGFQVVWPGGEEEVGLGGRGDRTTNVAESH